MKKNISLVTSLLLVIILFFVFYLGFYEYKRNQIESEYNNTLKINTIESYSSFIHKHKDTKYSADLIYYRDKKAYTNAKTQNTVTSYQLFLDTYPNSSWYSSAVYHRDKAALERAKEISRLEEIVLFLKEYPKSDWLPQAEHFLRHKFGFKNVSQAELYLMGKELDMKKQRNIERLEQSFATAKPGKKRVSESRGTKIIKDVDIFSDFDREHCAKLLTFFPKFKVRLVKNARPQIESVIRKYGQADKKTHSNVQEYFSFKLDEGESINQIIVYHYDNYGFVTEKEDSIQSIVYIFWSNDGVHRPQNIGPT